MAEVSSFSVYCVLGQLFYLTFNSACWSIFLINADGNFKKSLFISPELMQHGKISYEMRKLSFENELRQEYMQTNLIKNKTVSAKLVSVWDFSSRICVILFRNYNEVARESLAIFWDSHKKICMVCIEIDENIAVKRYEVEWNFGVL